MAVPPRVLHEIQPGIAPDIQASIRDNIVIPVRVRVSSSGTVISSVAEEDHAADELHRYLAERAATAGQLWSFSPARAADGTRLTADKTIYFVFSP